MGLVVKPRRVIDCNSVPDDIFNNSDSDVSADESESESDSESGSDGH